MAAKEDSNHKKGEADAYSLLRANIRSEGLKLPRILLKHSLIKIYLYSSIPFFLLLITLSLAKVGDQNWLIILFQFALLLCTQRCFQTLVHDSSHRFFSRNLKRNDFFANYLIAGWIGSTVQAYRAIHFKHHFYNGSTDDPEFISYSTVNEKGGLFSYIFKYLLCFEALRLFKKYYMPDSGGKNTEAKEENVFIFVVGLVKSKGHILFAQAILCVSFYLFDIWYMYLIWIYIAVSWSPLLSGLRFLVEHPDDSDMTVTTNSFFLEKIFFAPFNFNCHYEHHVWPSLPPYNLPAANSYLIDQGFFERHPEYINASFIGSLWKNAK